MAKNETICVNKLQGFELLIYSILKKHERDGVKSTLDEVHFNAIEYALNNKVNFKCDTDTLKVLKKLAIPNKATGEWNLKPTLFD